jgi:type III secretion protein Q
VLLLILEHRFAEAIEVLERYLKLPVALSGIDSQNPAGGPDIVHLNARCRLWEREYAIKLSLPAALAFQLADLLDATTGAQHNGAGVPIPVAYRIGVTQLGLRALESVRLGDIILADATAGAGMAFIAAGEQFLAKARWEGSTLTLLERPKKLEGYGEVWSMSNAANSGSVPDGIDTELNDIQIKLVFELGRQELRLGDVQSLMPGYVFDLNRDQRTAVDIYAGTQRIGLGEVVLINQTLGIRITRLFNNE